MLNYWHWLTIQRSSFLRRIQVPQMLICLCLLFSLAACALPRSDTPSLQLSMQVETSSRSGAYTITGDTTLPDQSWITVSAIRYLQPIGQAEGNTADLPYSILARQKVEVAQGRWQTTLNLWQVAPDGRYQEAWQLSTSKLGVSWQPNATVTFTATVEAVGQPASLMERLTKVENNLARFTADGQPYLQVSQTLPIELPQGKTLPSQSTTQNANNGWGDRSGI
jgi:hypothetical protein